MYIEKRERLKSRGRAKSNRARQGLNRFACTWKPPAHPSSTIRAVDFYLPVQDGSAHIPRLCRRRSRRRLCRMCTQVFKFSAPRTEYNAKESTRNGGPKGNDKRKEREREKSCGKEDPRK